LYLIFRGITALCGASHWAWILESNELGDDDFFCSIEYGPEGIVIRTFKEYDGIENACRGCLGDSDKVFFKRFITNRSYGEILSKVDEIKGNWKGCNQNLLNHNCIDSSEYENEVQLDYKQMNTLGRGWRNNHTKVNLYLIFRGITALCGASNWAWILESNE
jgi:hypothetical protein